jgi:ADP-heptose:LPS heptosyltransferase
LSKKIQHIAVMRLSAMGDVAMIVPVLRAFVIQNPNVKITFISRKFFKPFFEEIPNVTFFEFEAENRHKSFLGLMRLFQDLKKLDIDAFADLHNVLRSKIIRTLFDLTGKKTATVNKGRAEKEALTRSENKIFEQLPTMFERHCKAFETLGFQIDLSSPIFPEKAILDAEIQYRVFGIIQNNQYVSKKKLIGIAPFAQYDSKVYPLNLMRQVIDQLALNPENKILLFGGGKSEIEILNSLSANNENVINCAGKISFEKELKLISRLDVMLSMDSANAHISSMLGIKTITIWGATHPFAGFAPFNQRLENCLVADRNLYPKLPTSVYGNKIVEGYQDAMRTILPSEIISKIETII